MLNNGCKNGEAVGQARLREQEAEMTEARFADKLAESGETMLEMVPQFVNESPAKLQTRINRLTGEVTALGPVNLAALQELEALKSRRIHLEEQSHDLREAITTLEQAIRQIDRETGSVCRKHSIRSIRILPGCLLPFLVEGCGAGVEW